MKSLIIIFGFLPFAIFCQNNSKDSRSILIKQDSIFFIVDEIPSYPGGLAKMKEFIDKNIVRPPNYLKGTVFLKFIIDRTGKTISPQVLVSINPACDKAAMDVVLKFPKFSIPKHNGKPVDCFFNMPITFK